MYTLTTEVLTFYEFAIKYFLIFCFRGSVHLSNLKLAVTNEGFKKVKSTVQQSFCLRQILEKSIEYGIDTHPLFIGFMPTFGSFLAYADDINNVARDVPALREVFSSLKIAADPMGLTVNDS
ncbi:hypothetical protein CDAR_475071 [Caerostris darwini]|uniref:Uncharacterized protein n=1 Tax=Caerostris darwini TaxID=1538125 RepID=A0AAV4QL88_9ARAC|nr:hypothetical protein CDAR_475071 [Caerostris darwini]